jgi:hypothetical protein
MTQIRPIILANGSIGTPSNQMVKLFHVTPDQFGMVAPWRIKGAYLWVYQEGQQGQINRAGNDTWMYSDTCVNQIGTAWNAASIVQINKLTAHNPFNGQNFSAAARVDFGNDWVIANWLELYTQPESDTVAYVYAQINVYT